MFKYITNKNSILFQLIQFITILISIIVTFSSLLYSVREYQYIKASINNEITVFAKIIGRNYGHNQNINNNTIRYLLNSLDTQQEVNAALVTNIKNEIIAEYSKGLIKVNLNNDDSYTKKIPIYDRNNKLVGAFYIHANYPVLDTYFSKALFFSSLILLISIIISIIFSYYYSRSLYNPILKLSDNMHNIINNKNYRLKSEIHNAPDEIYDLNGLFNNLLTQISERDNEISSYNETLKLDIQKKDLELQESYQQLQFAAYHDELTHLPNIRLFKSILEYRLNQAKLTDSKFAVLFIDLDNFKQVNDSFGHDVGDELLKVISDIFVSTVRRSDFVIKTDLYKDVLPVSRLGGDEFTMVLNNIKGREDIDLVVKRLIKAVRNIKYIKQHTVHTSLSIGVAIYPQDGDDASTLLKHADAAMYHAKSQGKNTYEYYNHAIGTSIKARLKIESQLADAIIKDEFLIAYQPKFDIATNKIAGLEALIRWNHPKQGIIGPSEFINISEDSELICTISDIVIEKICKDISNWDKEGVCYDRVAVNISIRQFEKSDFVENLCMNIAKHGVKFCSLELELTEGMLVSNFEEAIKKLKKLKNIGFSIAIDDFGTGYSSFKYLSTLPVDHIKIDQMFVSNIEKNKNNYMIVKSIISLAHSLDLKIVAEGVENKQHVDILEKLGCNYVQGYYYSKPIGPSKIMGYLRDQAIIKQA